MKNDKFYEKLRVTQFFGEIGQKLAFYTGYALGTICESVHVKIALKVFWYCWNMSGVVKAHHSLIES
ncbi:MAG: hypothetical protein ABL933_02330 [Methyloglobulus sp.]|nr:hypothetical protein [Methyloglobulus sp.]